MNNNTLCPIPWNHIGIQQNGDLRQCCQMIANPNGKFFNDDGTAIGLWETDHPEGHNYIILEDPDIFHRTSTNLLRVVNKELKVLDPTPIYRVKLAKADSGQCVVKGHAALVLMLQEEYPEIEYYDQTNN